MRWPVAVLCVLCGAAAWALADTVILNEGCYLRHYYRFGVNRYSAAALRAEGEKVLGKTGIERLRRETEKAMSQEGLRPAEADWREHVMQPMYETYRPATAPAPADEWVQAGFDDAEWVLARGPFQWARPAGITTPQLGQFDESSMDLALQQGFYRARFVLDDPALAGELTLEMAYIGGGRAWINGREVARGHLSAGTLAADAPAEDYPAAAYTPAGEAQRMRRISAARIPREVLRKGVNVLAIEVRASQFHPVVLTNPRQVNWGGPTRPWPHGRLLGFALRSSASGVGSAMQRPPGTHAWAADVHQRVRTDDYLPAGEPAGSIRLVGARNGIYAGQVVVGTDRALESLRASATELRQAGGARTLPSAAITVSHLSPYPLDEWSLAKLGDDRGLDATFPSAKTLAAYASPAAGITCIFDRLIATPAVRVLANTSRPVWVSVRIPPDAAPGQYRGTVAISADGMPVTPIPVELEVVDWRLPDPKQFQTWVGCEQNPYGVAAHYGVKLWSDEHFKLMDASFAQLGRAGNTWLNVPVLMNTEFGNREDSPIRWVRKASGSWAFDYAILDRYLDLAAKHCGTPRMVQFVVMHGMKSPLTPPEPARVKFLDEATGREQTLDVPSSRREVWRAFATSLFAHMQARGWEKRMYWGSPWEQEADPGLKDVLAEVVPPVRWTAGPHEMMSNGTYAKNERFYSVITTIRYWQGWPGFRNDQGWKSRTPHLLNPRVGGTVFALHTTSLPFAYRMLPQRAVSLGRVGFTRVGADEWDAIHYAGMPLPKWLTGIPVLFMLWPGEQGAEPSVRFECLLEGIQETEARIFLEQALERGKLDEALAGRTRQSLRANLRETSFFQGNSIVHALEAYHHRWRERSAQLYRLAAEAAAKEGR